MGCRASPLIVRPSVPEDFEVLVAQFQGLNAYEDGIVGIRRRGARYRALRCDSWSEACVGQRLGRQ